MPTAAVLQGEEEGNKKVEQTEKLKNSCYVHLLTVAPTFGHPVLKSVIEQYKVQEGAATEMGSGFLNRKHWVKA